MCAAQLLVSAMRSPFIAPYHNPFTRLKEMLCRVARCWQRCSNLRSPCTPQHNF